MPSVKERANRAERERGYIFEEVDKIWEKIDDIDRATCLRASNRGAFLGKRENSSAAQRPQAYLETGWIACVLSGSSEK